MLSLGNVLFYTDETIGGYGDGIDACLDQQPRERRFIAGRLTSQANFLPCRLHLFDDLLDTSDHCAVFFIEDAGETLRIAIDSVSKLSQVVAADREAIEALGELFGENHIRRHLAHHVDLETVLATLQAVAGQFFKDFVSLGQRPAERDHDDHISKANLLPHFTYRAALQGKAVAVVVAIIAGPASSDHRIRLVGFELLAAN